MAKSKSKSKSSKEKEVDWAKIGKLNKPLVERITEPKQGVGTGKSIVDFHKPKPAGSVLARNVTIPQPPNVPLKNDSDSVKVGGVLTSSKDSDEETDENSKGYKENSDYKVSEMDSNTKTKKPQGRYSDSVRDIRPPRKDKNQGRKSLARKNGRDMHSGMELLGLEFLLSIVENVDGNEKNEVEMRKLCFNELIRTDQCSEIDSKALKFYVMDEEELYGKDIQYQAMQELSDRTSHS